MSAFLALSIAVLGSSPAQASEWTPVASQTVWGQATSVGDRDVPRSGATSGKSSARASLLVRDFSALSSVSRSTGMTGLLDLIASAEVREGYNAVQLAAKIKPPKRPTRLTLSEIRAWVKATPGQHHAIGRYQVIPKTFDRLVAKLGLSPETRFTPRVQDLMAKTLVTEAGYLAFRRGQLSRSQFQDNLAKVWAGLPMASGKSAYDGYAGNKATLTRAQFDRDMTRIFPGQRGAN